MTIDKTLVLYHPRRAPFSLCMATCKWLNERLDYCARSAFFNNLKLRCDDDAERPDKKKNSGREDMIGMLPDIDMVATMALLQGKKPMKAISAVIPEELSYQGRRALEAIIAGSICLNDRLLHMSRADTALCTCGKKETALPFVLGV